MKIPLLLTVGLALVALTNPAQAQRGMTRSNAVMKALDVDGDGTLSVEEIEQAAASLKNLDEDGDGVRSLIEDALLEFGPVIDLVVAAERREVAA